MKIVQRALSWASVFTLILLICFSQATPFASAAPMKLMSVSPGTKYLVTEYTNAIKSLPGANQNNSKVEIPGNVSSSPWRCEVYRNKHDKTWRPVKYAINGGNEMYLALSIDNTENWGNYPGGAFSLVSYISSEPQRTDGMMMTPILTAMWDDRVAWSFTAPVTGIYKFSRSPDETTRSFGESQYFKFFDGGASGKNYKHGVRITVDGETIWPKESDNVRQEDGYAIVTPGDDGKVSVPTIEGIILNSGQVLRLECRAFERVDYAYEFRMTCSALMEYTGEIPPDTTPPVFPQGATITNDAEAATHTTLSISWPKATDNETDENAIIYKVFYSTSQITSLEGKEGVTAPAKTSFTITGLEGDTNYYVAVAAYDAAGNYSFITGGPFKTLTPPPPVLKSYELYDFYEDIQAILDAMPEENPKNVDISLVESDSPWRAKVLGNDGWTLLNRANRESDGYIYLRHNNISWAGSNWPGVSFYAPKDYDGVGRRDLAYLSPSHGSSDSSAPGFKANMALVFTAPEAGVYTFRRSNPDRANSEEYTKYFRAGGSGASNLKFGIRVVVGKNTIWPTENSGVTIQEGYALIDGYSDEFNAAKWIEIPEIQGIILKAGEQLMVEATAFDAAKWPWYQKLTACVAMDLNSVLGEDTKAPEFASGSITKVSETNTSLKVQWPEAVDDQVASENIKYTVYASKTAFNVDNLPTSGGITVTGETQAEITELESGTEYYVLVVAEDSSGNKAALTGGPFKTSSSSTDDDPGEEPGDDYMDIDEPLTPNMPEGSSGIISADSGSVTVGWNAAAGVTNYRVFLFSKSGNSYTLENSSAVLDAFSNQYTFINLSNNFYVIQVVGYNIQNEITAIYDILDLNYTSGGSGGSGGSGNGTKPPKTGELVSMAVLVPLFTASSIIIERKSKKKQKNV